MCKLYKELIQLCGKYTINLISKMGKGPKWTIFFMQTYKWTTGTSKGSQSHWSSAKRKPAPQWDMASHVLGRDCQKMRQQGWGRCGEKAAPGHRGGVVNWQVLWKTAAFSHKVKNRTTIFSSNSNSGIYPKEMKTGSPKDICTSCLLQCYSP